MDLDEKDIELLRQTAKGHQDFRSENESEEAMEAFEHLGDKLLSLRDRGLIEVKDYYERTASGKRPRVYVLGITERGRLELARHEPLGETAIQAVRRKIAQELKTRSEQFHRQYEGITGNHVQRGTLTSGMFLTDSRRAVADEYLERGRSVLSIWRQVAAARNLAFSPLFAARIRAELDKALSEGCGDLKEVFESAKQISGGLGKGALSKVHEEVMAQVNADIDFEAIAPGASRASASTGGHQFTVHGNIGALQTGDNATAAVTIYLAGPERDQVLSDLRELERLVAHADEAPAPSRVALQQTIAVAIREAESAQPNRLTLGSLTMGVCIAIQTLGSIPGAIEISRRLAALFGFHL